MRLATPPGTILAAVAVGGFAGTLLRYGLGLAVPETGAFPSTTLAINAAGSLVLGFLTAWWSRLPVERRWLQAGLGPGLLGSFTTFSAVSVAIATSWWPGSADPWVLLGYLALSLLLGLAAAALGYAAGRRNSGHRLPAIPPQDAP